MVVSFCCKGKIEGDIPVHCLEVCHLIITKINLLNYLQIDTERVIINDIRFKRPTGSNISEIDKISGDLTITGQGIIAIVAYVGDENAPTYKAELKIMVQ